MYSVSAENFEGSFSCKYAHDSGAGQGQGSRDAEELPSLDVFETQLYVVPGNFDQQVRLDDLPFNLNYCAAFEKMLVLDLLLW